MHMFLAMVVSRRAMLGLNNKRTFNSCLHISQGTRLPQLQLQRRMLTWAQQRRHCKVYNKRLLQAT